MVLALPAACLARTTPLASQPVASPVELRGVPAHNLVRSPSVAARSDTVFVAGNVLPTLRDSLLARPAYLGRLLQSATGALVALDPLELPPGDFQFAHPRVGVSPDAIHLVWAEFSPRPLTGAGWVVAFSASLWHAVLRNGSWSTPERIAAGTVLGWNHERGAIAVTDAGVVHVAVGVGDSVPAVRHIRLAQGQWRTTSLQSGGWGPSALTVRGDTVLIALEDARVPATRVLLFRSNDQGERWGPPTVVSSRDHGTVASLALTAVPGGTLLAIAEKPFESFYVDTIRLVRMRGVGGAPIAGLVTPPDLVATFVLTATPCGSAVMLASTFAMTPQIFDLRIPRDSLTARTAPLLSDAESAAFPGVGSTRHVTVAVFSYKAPRDVQVRSVAMPLTGCTR